MYLQLGTLDHLIKLSNLDTSDRTLKLIKEIINKNDSQNDLRIYL